MDNAHKSALFLTALLMFFPALAPDARAFQLAGAWATSADLCGKVFLRKGRANTIEFSALSDRHGGGFIVESNRIRGKFTSCVIKTRKDDGQVLNLIVRCSADMMLSNVQFILKVLADDSVVRQFPGIEEDVAMKYYRCSI